MQPFDLSLWLKDKSRKVVTRLNKQVQIISTEGREDIPIIALVEGIAHQYKSNGFHADVVVAYSNQCRDMGDYDIFFADEKEELTEFEKQLGVYIYYPRLSCGFNEEEKKYIKDAANTLLNLARKEIESERDRTCEEVILSQVYGEGYEQGKQDALKYLPKWKKAEKEEEFDCYIAIQQDDRVVLSDFVQKDEYYITFDVLKKLPKEE